MPGTYAPYPRLQFFDNNGDPLDSGSLETYLAGTSTPKATHSDVGLTVSNPTTLTLNAAGVPQVSGTEVAVFLTPGISYKFIIKDSAGATVATRDNISSVPAVSVDIDVAGTAGEGLAAGDAAYLSDGSGGRTAGRWYKTDSDLPYASASAIMVGLVPSAITTGESGSFRISGRLTGLSGLTTGAAYYLSATAGELTATAPSNRRFVGIADSTTSLILTPNPPPNVDPSICFGRLTLTSGTAVTTSDVTAAGTIYFTPFRGNRVALYDGTRWALYTFTERSLALSVSVDTNYDVFLYDNAGTLTLELTAWTNATTRATAIVLQDGVYVKSGVTTRRYLGTIRGSGANTTEDSAAKRFVWNYAHRMPRDMRVTESTDSWAYTTATWRQARAQAANQLAIVNGVAEDMIDVAVSHVFNSSSAGAARAGVGEDSTSAPSGLPAVEVSDSSHKNINAALRKIPAIGYHFYAWLEMGGTNTTFFGDNGGTDEQSGIIGTWRC